MFDKRLVRHTVTMYIHINISSQSIFLVWKRNCEYSVCEGEIVGLEAKALVWKCNCGTPKLLCGSGTTELASGSGILDFKVIQYFMSGTGTAEIKVTYIPTAEAELRHRGTYDKEYSEN